ncbi:MAG: PDZ domain-containing protein [Candidatus Thioglobus sp.]|nr:MAG: PDZ domain-containing protein [Candidatus Thioglobus sp.]
MGIKCEFIRKEDQLSNFGFAIDKTQKPPVVTHIFANSCAQNFGLYAKDKIIKINGAKIDGKNLAKELSAYNEGDIVKVEIRRDELPVELKIKIKFSPKSHCILTPTQKNISRQKQWFTGEL